jgi:hypothetical protein
MTRDVSLLFDMTDEEIDADLRSDGSLDPNAIAKRGVELVQALLKRKRLPLDIPAEVRKAAVTATDLVERRHALIRKLQEDDMMGLECAETVELEGLEAQEIQAVRVIAPWIIQVSKSAQVSVRTGEAGDPGADPA